MKLSWITFLMFFFFSFGYSQEESVEKDENKETPIRQKSGSNPTIGIGAGVVKFYGDLNDRDYGTPFTGNTSFSLYLVQPINDFLNLRLNFMQTTVKEEERSLERNLNYSNTITAFAAMVEYNFDHFLPKDRIITPFVTSGIEIFNFSPKTDLFDAGGARYNYWSDGTIRNVGENSPEADQSMLIQRDFDYETDIKSSGLNGSTTYDDFTFSIPVGIGFDMRLNDNFNLKFESILHFGFTDNVDGISSKTSKELVQNKRANGRNDFFYYNGVSLSYNFDKVKPAEKFDIQDDEPINFLASENREDFDNDGVIDLVDRCPNTGANIKVDSLGCPIDTDGDGIPDYKDEEINTEYPEFANDKGVEMSDEMIYRSYMQFQDSTLEFAETIERDFSIGRKKSKRDNYRVKVEEYARGETPPNMEKLLSLSDLSKLDQNGKTLFTVGKYKTVNEASQRAQKLKKDGFEKAAVIKKDQKSGKYVDQQIKSPQEELSKSIDSDPNETKVDEQKATADNQVVYRVQLGAFKNKPNSESYQKIPNLFIEEANGFFRYMSGSFSNFNEAAKHKVKMVVEGYKGAFVVAYKNGKRVSLKSVGVKSLDSDPILGK